ncbi:fatty acid hydroxylase family protein [Beijerinckia sp. L45]|uniref:fatty acid hydroxylase family protein n=1 Tax=Beijerinckia sp. L45 TaxID=1641855 RepID=UPI00131D9C26|nr:fatty acid hydroxylase family protein [Beijerinckia sp. L45]
MMTARQEAFRTAYRAQIAALYDGIVHVALIFLIGGAALWYCVQNIHAPTWLELLVIPIVVIFANVFEWFLHAQVMHRPRPGFMGIYKRHTLAHHQFFTEHEPFHDTTKDYRIVFFPPYAEIAFLVMASAMAYGVSLVWSTNAALILVASAAGMYMNYEFFHWCCHVRDDRIIKHIPFVNTIRRHHIAHHDTAIMMSRNMNLTYPFADWLFGTSDVQRGLLGTLLNGYETRFVRKDLPKVRSSADVTRPAVPAE